MRAYDAEICRRGKTGKSAAAVAVVVAAAADAAAAVVVVVAVAIWRVLRSVCARFDPDQGYGMVPLRSRSLALRLQSGLLV